MNIDFKYFQFSSIEFTSKRNRYTESFYFNNYFSDIKRMRRVFQKYKELLNRFSKLTKRGLIAEIESKERLHWSLKQSNGEVEFVLFVLQNYGYSRDFIIRKIFGGYCSENLETDTEVIERFLGNDSFIVKVDVHHQQPARERLIGLIRTIDKRDIFFPLFIDVNHCLYHDDSETVSNDGIGIESLQKEIILKWPSSLVNNVFEYGKMDVLGWDMPNDDEWFPMVNDVF